MLTNINASFIFPATEARLANRLINTLGNKFTNFEAFPLYGMNSFFQTWRNGLSKAKKKYLVLTHQDVEFISIPDLDKIFSENTGMIGPAGTKIITKKDPWWFSPGRLENNHLSGEVFHKKGGKRMTKSFYGKYGEVLVLDGVCLITEKEILAKVGVPKITWARWDFYDHVISLKFINKGYTLKTSPIKLVHFSSGEKRRPDYFKNQEIFVKTYF